MSVTLASLAAVGFMAVYVRRQRAQLALLQRERSTSLSFSDFSNGGAAGAKLATLHTFTAGAADGGAGGGHHKTPRERLKTLSIPNPWAEEHEGGYIQVRAVLGGCGSGGMCGLGHGCSAPG